MRLCICMSECMCARVCVYSSKYRVAEFQWLRYYCVVINQLGKKGNVNYRHYAEQYIHMRVRMSYVYTISIFILHTHTHTSVYIREQHRHDVIHMSAYGNQITATKM